jgi:hypothetical protein
VRQLSSAYLAEGAGHGDFDGDGNLDVVCGRVWWRGPDFRERRVLERPTRRFPIGSYSDVFFTFGDDVDRDGDDDVVWIGFPGTGAWWFENVGGAGTQWTRHTIRAFGVDTESPTYVDVDGDGVREIVCGSGGALGLLRPGPAGPTAPWVFTAISPPGPWTAFAHGLGVGDVNGDGRSDVLVPLGWLEQPLTPGAPWIPHPQVLGFAGAQMHAFDADGDGDQDVATSIQAHGYGLSWFEQTSPGTFAERSILPLVPTQAWHFSQMHAVGAADIDGDGLEDLVTGKTFLAHLGTDPGAFDPAVLYVFLQRRDPILGTRFDPVLVHADSGVGRQVDLVDLDGDGRTDIVVGNKKGVFVFHNRIR